MKEEMTQLSLRVDAVAKELAKSKLEHGQLSEEVRALIDDIAYGPDVILRSSLQRKHADLQQQLRELRERRREIEAEIETTENRLTAVTDDLDKIAKESDRYEGALRQIEARLRFEGGHYDPGHGQIINAAKIGGKEPEGVMKDLKERNPDVPDDAFVPAYKASRHFHGLPEEQARKEVSERD